MSVKIWQVPNKSKAMAQVFKRKSGVHVKTKSRVKERLEWTREVTEELVEEPGAQMLFDGDAPDGVNVICAKCYTKVVWGYEEPSPKCPHCKSQLYQDPGAEW